MLNASTEFTLASINIATDLMTSGFLWLLLLGSFGGLLAGLLGVGGGMLFIPVITSYLQQYDISSTEMVKFTLANSIALVFMSGVSGTFRQIKMGTWQWKQSLTIGIPGAISNYFMTQAIQDGEWYQKEVFQGVFLGFLGLSILNMIFGKSKSSSPTEGKGKNNPDIDEQSTPYQFSLIQDWPSMLVGIFAGTIVALSGLGGGIIMVPLFLIVLKKSMHSATALSLSIVPILSISALIKYISITPTHQISSYQTGYLLWIMLIPMLLGVIFFSSLGQKMATKVPVVWLRIIFALLSAFILVKTLLELYS
ncbi:anion permease [Bacteroidota bacterium]|nr:anion permease [Bacteroidota bacterium]